MSAFLIDQPVSPMLAAWLREQGHDAFHVRDRSLSGATDEALFAIAAEEKRTIVTTDLDFPRLAALACRDRPGVIVFRAGNITDDQMLSLLKRALATVPLDRLASAITTVEAVRLRIADLPLRAPSI